MDTYLTQVAQEAARLVHEGETQADAIRVAFGLVSPPAHLCDADPTSAELDAVRALLRQANVDPMERASRVLDAQAGALEQLAREWRREADYLRNGDRSTLGNAPGCHARYARSSLLSRLLELQQLARRLVRELEGASS